jgi:hypothetical protein
MPDEWYYTQDGRGHGPVSDAQLRQLLKSRQLRPNDIIWQEGMTEKVRVEDVLVAQEETPAEPPGPAAAPGSAAPPAGGPDWLRDVAAGQSIGPAGRPVPHEPTATPRDWLEDVRQGNPPPRRLAPHAAAPPLLPSAAAALAAGAAQEPPADLAPPPRVDVELIPLIGDLTPATPPPEPARDRPVPPSGVPRAEARRSLVILGSFALSACVLGLALVALGVLVLSGALSPGLGPVRPHDPTGRAGVPDAGSARKPTEEIQTAR